jgi:hypothetical protein
MWILTSGLKNDAYNIQLGNNRVKIPVWFQGTERWHIIFYVPVPYLKFSENSSDQLLEII